MSLSMQWSKLPIIIQSDSSTAIASFDLSEYGHLMPEIKKLFALRGFILLERSQNRVAHMLATPSVP
jgi:hypothetical protein